MRPEELNAIISKFDFTYFSETDIYLCSEDISLTAKFGLGEINNKYTDIFAESFEEYVVYPVNFYYNGVLVSSQRFIVLDNKYLLPLPLISKDENGKPYYRLHKVTTAFVIVN